MLNLLKEVKDLTQESIRIRSKIDIREQIETVVGAIRDAARNGITQRRFLRKIMFYPRKKNTFCILPIGK